jgi:hypothetical protein
MMKHMEKTLYGYKITFDGPVDEATLRDWLEESQAELKHARPGFRVLVDMRRGAPPPDSASPLYDRARTLFRNRGMQSSLVLLPDRATTLDELPLAG